MAYLCPKAWRAVGFRFYPVQHQRVSMQEARLAKEKMHGRLACARPFVVRLASERYLADLAEKSSEGVGEISKAGGGSAGSSLGQMSRSARIAAIKNKLKALEEESSSAKKQKHADS